MWLVFGWLGVVWAGRLVGRPLGWPDLVATAVALVGLAVAVGRPTSQGLVPAVVRGPGHEPRVALTFDDGPDPATTPEILSILRRHGALATFFVLADKAERHPDVLRALRADGHEVALHGEVHRWQALVLPWRAKASLGRGKARLRALVGEAPRYFRPPYGVVVPALRGAVKAAGLTVVAWSIRTHDAVGQGEPGERVRFVLDRVAPGAIVLMHDAPERPGGRPPLSLAMLDPLLEALTRRGLRCVTVRELLAG